MGPRTEGFPALALFDSSESFADWDSFGTVSKRFSRSAVVGHFLSDLLPSVAFGTPRGPRVSLAEQFRHREQVVGVQRI
jgi:hypothetical protein